MGGPKSVSCLPSFVTSSQPLRPMTRRACDGLGRSLVDVDNGLSQDHQTSGRKQRRESKAGRQESGQQLEKRAAARWYRTCRAGLVSPPPWESSVSRDEWEQDEERPVGSTGRRVTRGAWFPMLVLRVLCMFPFLSEKRPTEGKPCVTTQAEDSRQRHGRTATDSGDERWMAGGRRRGPGSHAIMASALEVADTTQADALARSAPALLDKNS